MSAPSREERAAWSDVVALMRLDARELGRDPANAPRFLQRCTASSEALTAQLRRGWGLNAHEMQAVSVLWEFGRMTMTELGRRIPLSRAAVTTLTDRLESLGYVRRLPDPADRRRILLEVTARVEEELARIQGRWSARVEEYARTLDETTWQSVVEVLATLRDIAREEAAALRELSREELLIVGGGRSPGRPATITSDDPPNWW